MEHVKKRYFYIPQSAVIAELEQAKKDVADFDAKIKAFMHKHSAVDCYRQQDYPGKITALVFAGTEPPNGWRKIRVERDGSGVVAKPDKRTSIGKAIDAELKKVNEYAVVMYAELKAAAHRYGLDRENCISEHFFLSHFSGMQVENEKAFLIRVPSGEGSNTLKDDEEIPYAEELTELTESEFIAVTKEGKSLESVLSARSLMCSLSR